MADSVVPKAVSKITSVSGETWLTTWTTSRPSIPGMRRSTTINSTGCVRTYSTAACPFGTEFTMYPSSRKISESDWRATGSSSTTRIFDFIVYLQSAGIIESTHQAHVHPIDPAFHHVL